VIFTLMGVLGIIVRSVRRRGSICRLRIKELYDTRHVIVDRIENRASKTNATERKGFSG